jgi:hypothetical protein
MLPLDPLGHVLGRRVGDLVPEHRGETGVVLGHRQDPCEHDDLAARQAVGVGLLLADERHPPDEVRLVTARNDFDAPRDALYLGVLRPFGDDARTVLAQRLGVLLAAELHLLCIGEGHVLNSVRDRSLLPVTVHHQDADDDGCDDDRDQRASDEERKDCLRGANITIDP